MTGDLAVPGPWQESLAGAETVVHLAALTGKGSRSAHERSNLDTTRGLVDAARAAGARRFLFVSSIAASYEDRRHYHYADAKARAEEVVRTSGMTTLVVRPTMVLGPASPVLANLRRLATLPIPVMFGAGRAVQPIHVDDLADQLMAALEAPTWPVPMVELGGPETLELAELLARIRAAARLPPRKPIHIPLAPVRALLALLEPVLLPVLPFTAGQMAAFANPAVAGMPPAEAGIPGPRRGLDAMLEPPGHDGAAVAPEVPSAEALNRECRSFSRYLTGRAPSDYVATCYRRSVVSSLVPAPQVRPIDRLLLGTARLGRWAARPADAYARFARPTGPLRRRLTLMLAILESAPDTHAWCNTAATGSTAAVLTRFGASLAAGGLNLVLGALVFGPLHLLSAPFGRGASRGGA